MKKTPYFQKILILGLLILFNSTLTAITLKKSFKFNAALSSYTVIGDYIATGSLGQDSEGFYQVAVVKLDTISPVAKNIHKNNYLFTSCTKIGTDPRFVVGGNKPILAFFGLNASTGDLSLVKALTIPNTQNFHESITFRSNSILQIENSNFFMTQYWPLKMIKFDSVDMVVKSEYDSFSRDIIENIQQPPKSTFIFYQNNFNSMIHVMTHSDGKLIKIQKNEFLGTGSTYRQYIEFIEYIYKDVLLFGFWRLMNNEFYIYDYTHDSIVYSEKVTLNEAALWKKASQSIKFRHLKMSKFGLAINDEFVLVFDIFNVNNAALDKDFLDIDMQDRKFFFDSMLVVETIQNKFMVIYDNFGDYYEIANEIICTYPCLTCDVVNAGNPAGTCKTCVTGYTLQTKTCVKTCPAGQVFIDGTGCAAACKESQFETVDRICGDCHANCLTCYGRWARNCKKCKNNKIINSELDCVDSCKDGEFSDGSKCLKCPQDCKKCSDGQTCDECYKGYFLKEKKCHRPCSRLFYYNYEERQCRQCIDGCFKCSTSKFCEECVEGYLYFQNQCMRVCPPGYTSNLADKSCKRCQVNCLRCLFDQNYCVTCSNGFYLLNGICMSKCPENYFTDTLKQGCFPCIENCKVCDREDCLECVDGYFKNFLGKCQPTHTFFIKSLRYVYFLSILGIFFIGLKFYNYNRKLMKNLIRAAEDGMKSMEGKLKDMTIE